MLEVYSQRPKGLEKNSKQSSKEYLHWELLSFLVMRVSQEPMNALIKERICFKLQYSHTGTYYVGPILLFFLGSTSSV